MRYDPLSAPDPQEWLQHDEQERIELVESYHRAKGVALENTHLHAAFNASVETQLAEGSVPAVAETLERLMREGLDRHQAVHAIGSVLAQTMYNSAKRAPTGDLNERYAAELRRLTARRWSRS